MPSAQGRAALDIAIPVGNEAFAAFLRDRGGEVARQRVALAWIHVDTSVFVADRDSQYRASPSRTSPHSYIGG